MSATTRPSQSILIIDGDVPSRTALSTALERAGYATELACTAEEALDLARRRPPAVAILETDLPGACGYEVCRELRERHGEGLPIIFISAVRTDECAQVAGLLLGADDYFTKPIATDRLVARVRRLAARSTTLASPIASHLTPREREVLTLLAEGLEQDQIAQRLFITPRTVAKHIERILSKLGVRSRAQAIALAMRGDGIGAAAI